MKKIFDQVQKIEAATKEDLFIFYSDLEISQYTDPSELELEEEDSKTIGELLRQREQKTESICFVIQSMGGKISEAIEIAKELRRHYARVNFVVLTHAASSAAYLCLCGDTLYMSLNAMVTDFGPTNWQSGVPATVKSAEEGEAYAKQLVASLSALYNALVGQLIRGMMKGDLDSVTKTIVELGGPCIGGVLPNGKRHGTPLALQNLRQIVPTPVAAHILPYTDIPAPGAQGMPYIAPTFAKLNKLIRRKMFIEKQSKLALFGGQSATVKSVSRKNEK